MFSSCVIKDLAIMGSVITNNGIHPKTKKHILKPEHCQFIKELSVLLVYMSFQIHG